MVICISRRGSVFDNGICLLTLRGPHRNCLLTTSRVRSSVARLVDIAARVACSSGALPGDPQGLAECGAQQSYDSVGQCTAQSIKISVTCVGEVCSFAYGSRLGNVEMGLKVTKGGGSLERGMSGTTKICASVYLFWYLHLTNMITWFMYKDTDRTAQ